MAPIGVCRRPNNTASHWRGASLVGLGKEGMKIAARLKLGRGAGSEPVVFVDWKPRLLAMDRAEADRLSLRWGTVRAQKHRLKLGTLKENGAAVRRLKLALTT